MDENGKKTQKEIAEDKIKIILASIALALLIVMELYVMINYKSNFLAMAVGVLLMIVALFFLISALMDMSIKAKEVEEQKYEEIYNAQKASYLVIKKSFDELEQRLTVFEENSALPAEDIINAQKAVAKVTISRSKENTDALMNSNDELINQLLSIQEKIDSNNSQIMESQQTLIKETNNDIQQKIEALASHITDIESRIQNGALTASTQVPQTPPPIVEQPAAPVVEEIVQEVAAEESQAEEIAQEATVEEPQAEEIAQEATAEEPQVEEIAQEATVEEPQAEEIAQEATAEEPQAEEIVQEAAAEEPQEEDIVQEVAAEEPQAEETVQEAEVEDLGIDLDTIVEEPGGEDIGIDLDSATENDAEDEVGLDLDTLTEDTTTETDNDSANDKEDEPLDLGVDLDALLEEIGEVPGEDSTEAGTNDSAEAANKEGEIVIPDVGVDLTDPNRVMSAEEIEKLFANI